MRTRAFNRLSVKALKRSSVEALGSAIPTGLCLPAQGCEERATLGTARKCPATPTGLRPCPLFSSQGAATLSGLNSSSTFPQGSSFLATQGFVSESLWDSALLRMSANPSNERPPRPQQGGGAVGWVHAIRSGLWKLLRPGTGALRHVPDLLNTFAVDPSTSSVTVQPFNALTF